MPIDFKIQKKGSYSNYKHLMHRHDVPQPFYLMYLMKKKFTYHFHLAGIITFSLLYTIGANDNLNHSFVYFIGALITSFFLMLCEVNIYYTLLHTFSLLYTIGTPYISIYFHGLFSNIYLFMFIFTVCTKCY